MQLMAGDSEQGWKQVKSFGVGNGYEDCKGGVVMVERRLGCERKFWRDWLMIMASRRSGGRDCC